MMNKKKFAINAICTMLVGGALLTGCGNKKAETPTTPLTHEAEQQVKNVPAKDKAGKELTQTQKNLVAESLAEQKKVDDLVREYFVAECSLTKDNADKVFTEKFEPILGKEMKEAVKTKGIPYTKEHNLSTKMFSFINENLKIEKITYLSDNKLYDGATVISKVVIIQNGTNVENAGKKQEITFETKLIKKDGQYLIVQSNDTNTKILNDKQ